MRATAEDDRTASSSDIDDDEFALPVEPEKIQALLFELIRSKDEHALVGLLDDAAGVDVIGDGTNLVNAPDSDGMTPLFHARKNDRIIRILCQYGADVMAPSDSDGNTIAYHCRRSVATLLLLQSICGSDAIELPCETDGTTVLYYLRRSCESLAMLHEAGAKVDGKVDGAGNTLAYYAVMRVLHAADDAKREMAARTIRTLQFDLQLSFSAPCEPEGNSPLYFAATNEPLLEVLASTGVDLNSACDSQGATVTYYARDNEQMLRRLHEMGANLSLPCDQVGNTLEYYADFDPDLEYLLEQLEIEFPDLPPVDETPPDADSDAGAGPDADADVVAVAVADAEEGGEVV